MPIMTLPKDGSTSEPRFKQQQSNRGAKRERPQSISLGCGMGTTRSDVDLMAAQSRNLAGTLRGHSARDRAIDSDSCRGGKVHVLGGPDSSYESAVRQVGSVPNVEVHPILTNDVWIRDYGPTFVTNEEGSKLGAVLWKFNAWGNKYHPHDDDAAASSRITDLLKATNDIGEVFCSDLVAEGGGLETDGEGTLLATSSSIKTYSRNPNWNDAQIESELKRLLGIDQLLWIDGGELAGDDTDSHIDQLVRFIRPGVVASAVSYSLDDSNAPKLAKQFEVLKNCIDARGRRFEIVPLVTPPPRYIHGKRVPESYCNFYIANGIVIVPTFGYRETDDAAVAKLGELFPHHDIIPIDAASFIWGSVHFIVRLNNNHA